MKLYNSLTKKVEEFVPSNPPKVGMYTCGPTVYFYPHIGNWRTFVLGDLLVRTLNYLGFKVDYVMNLTDVGHLTGDNLGDASAGEDRLEKESKKEGKSVWDVAAFYTNDFLAGYKKLHLTQPMVFCKATDHIAEQIQLVQRIEAAGFTYRIDDGIYFDVKKYEQAGNTYGLMSNIHIDTAQERIAENKEKHDKRDFALWKFSPSGEQRQMEWESPWGKGFPGWHIECSAMSMKYLGDQFDIHVGGEDHKSTHHPNEIAQAEAATGKKPFVKYWVHGAFLTVDGGRMGKSLGNAYTLQDIEAKGYSVMDLRYFYLTGHYRKQLNFTWEALAAARQARLKLNAQMQGFRAEQERTVLSKEKLVKVDAFRDQFRTVIGNDLHIPEALALVWAITKNNIPGGDKYDLIREMDEVLGLGISEPETMVVSEVPEAVATLIQEREAKRAAKDYIGADQLRTQIEAQGYVIEDAANGTVVKKRVEISN